METFTTTDDLVKACLNDDEHAWRALVGRFGPMVWSIARAHRLNAADSDEVSQATWVRLWRNLGGLREPARLAEWLSMIARRESLRLLQAPHRRAEARPSEELARVADDAESVEGHVLSEDRAQQLSRAVRELPPRCQQMVALLIENRSYVEIAAALDISSDSVGPIRNRCLARLRALLNEPDGTAAAPGCCGSARARSAERDPAD